MPSIFSSLGTLYKQGSQLLRIERETHAFHTQLTLTRIASFFSRIMQHASAFYTNLTHSAPGSQSFLV